MVKSTYSHFCKPEYRETYSAFEVMDKGKAHLLDKYKLTTRG